MNAPHLHPDGARLEAAAADELPPDEAREVAAHLSVCARCSAEVEGWSLLFSELGRLPEERPREGFAERVLAEVELVPPLRVRVADRIHGFLRGLGLGTSGPSAGGVRHLTPAGIQDYLEGALAGRVRTRVEAHVAACGGCRREVDGYRDLLATLTAVPRLTPTAGFSDRVMDRVAVAAVAEVAERASVPIGRRLAEAARGFLPKTRRGWLVAGGVGAAPTVGVIAVVAAIASHPLLTFSDLFVFMRWRAVDALGDMTGRIIGGLVETRIFTGFIDVLMSAAQAPAAVGGALLLMASLLVGATLVVYRNLIVPSRTGENHVQSIS